MSPRLRNAQIRLKAELLRSDIHRLYQAGPTRGKIKRMAIENGELKIRWADHDDSCHWKTVAGY